MYRLTPLVVFTPRLIIVPGLLAECCHYPGQVVSVLSTYMFFDERNLSADSIGWHGHYALRS